MTLSVKYKKLFILILTLIACVRGWAQGAQQTDVSTLDYAVYTNEVSAKPGEQVTLQVAMKNVNPITLWQAVLQLPDGVTIAEDNFGDPMVELYEGTGKRTSSTRHSIAMNPATGMILCNSSTNKTFTGTDGQVASITINIPAGLQAGTYNIVLAEQLMVEADGTGHRVASTTSQLKINVGMRGDVNDDGVVNISDVTTLVNIILGKGTDTYGRADLNNDTLVNISDVTTLVNIILGKG